MTEKELAAIKETVLQVKRQLAPDLNDSLMEAILRIELETADNDEAAVRAIQRAIERQ